MGHFFSVETDNAVFSFVYESTTALLRRASKQKLDNSLLRLLHYIEDCKLSTGFGQKYLPGEMLRFVGIHTPGKDPVWGYVRQSWPESNILYNTMGRAWATVDTENLVYLFTGHRHSGMTTRENDVFIEKLTNDLLAIMASLPKNWRRARQAWKRNEKKNGALAKAQAQQKLDAVNERLEAKLLSKKQARHLIKLLEAQVINIDNDDITREKCRMIFDAQNTMTALHSRLKKAYGIH